MNDPDTANGQDPKTILRDWWRDTQTAAAFLTRIPLLRGERISDDAQRAEDEAAIDGDLTLASRAFPLVGFLIGLIGGAVLVAAKWIGLSPFLAAALAIAAVIAITGALHEDGLADAAEGFGAGRDRQARLAIMRDTRLGAFAVLALVLSVVVRIGALAAISGTFAAAGAMIAAAAYSRAVLPAVMAWFEPAKTQGLAVTAGKPPADRVLASVLLGALFALLFLGPAAGFLAIIAGSAAAGGCAVLAKHELGGYTGDVLGAIQQLTEIAVLIIAAAL
jgi:adenosylcobinamide-GDP ribazoletransferase